jgi:hypothetical protein
MNTLDFTNHPEVAHLEGPLQRYFENRIAPGGFLTAVLSNDLVGAVSRADQQNRSLIPEIVIFLYNRAPAGAWGNEDRVARWLRGE